MWNRRYVTPQVRRERNGLLRTSQIQYANANDVPFLAVSGGHGGTVSLGKVKHGVGIWMRKMNDIKIASNGKSAAIGGGIRSKEFAHTLAKHGKQSGE